ncbi:hypothetical protein JHK85_010706 [Glycine max]|nr:hypothetical protein JHK85_010706 [Glycine max]
MRNVENDLKQVMMAMILYGQSGLGRVNIVAVHQSGQLLPLLSLTLYTCTQNSKPQDTTSRTTHITHCRTSTCRTPTHIVHHCVPPPTKPPISKPSPNKHRCATTNLLEPGSTISPNKHLYVPSPTSTNQIHTHHQNLKAREALVTKDDETPTTKGNNEDNRNEHHKAR